MGKRIDFIDVAKGIAVISIIMGHLKFGQGSFDPIWRLVFQYHVPIFFIVAGCFLSNRGTMLEFIRDKARRLLVPYVYTCAVMFLILLCYRNFLGGTNPPSLFPGMRAYVVAACYGAGSDLSPVPEGVLPIGALWYLEALFVALIEVRLATGLGRWQGPIVFALAVVACVSARTFFLPFNIQSGLLGGAFVYLGTLFRSWGLLEKPFDSKVALVCAAISALAYYFDITISITRLFLGRWYLGPLVAVTSSVLVLQISQLISQRESILKKVLEFYGANSLAVFCAHLVLLNMGFKYMLFRLTGIDPVASRNAMFCLNLPLQLIITALFVVVAKKAPLAKAAFYPSKRPKRADA